MDNENKDKLDKLDSLLEKTQKEVSAKEELKDLLEKTVVIKESPEVIVINRPEETTPDTPDTSDTSDPDIVPPTLDIITNQPFDIPSDDLNHNLIREMSLKLLDSQDGINKNGYALLTVLISSSGNGDILENVQIIDDKVFIEEIYAEEELDKLKRD